MSEQDDSILKELGETHNGKKIRQRRYKPLP